MSLLPSLLASKSSSTPDFYLGTNQDLDEETDFRKQKRGRTSILGSFWKKKETFDDAKAKLLLKPMSGALDTNDGSLMSFESLEMPVMGEIKTTISLDEVPEERSGALLGKTSEFDKFLFSSRGDVFYKDECEFAGANQNESANQLLRGADPEVKLLQKRRKLVGKEKENAFHKQKAENACLSGTQSFAKGFFSASCAKLQSDFPSIMCGTSLTPDITYSKDAFYSAPTQPSICTLSSYRASPGPSCPVFSTTPLPGLLANENSKDTRGTFMPTAREDISNFPRREAGNCSYSGFHKISLFESRLRLLAEKEATKNTERANLQLNSKRLYLQQSYRQQLQVKPMAPSITCFSHVEERSATVATHPSHNPIKCQAPSTRTGPETAKNFFKNSNGNASSNICPIPRIEQQINPIFFSTPPNLGQLRLSERSYCKLFKYFETKNIISSEMLNLIASDIPLEDISSTVFGLQSNYVIGNYTPYYAKQFKLLLARLNQKLQHEVYSLARVFETVEECPWYWGVMSGTEAAEQLKGTKQGTFLLRDSSDERYLFSLSLMSKRGPTSIRIVYSSGYFRLESERDDETIVRRRRSLPRSRPRRRSERSRCVIEMILHYTKHFMTKDTKENAPLNPLTRSHTEIYSQADVPDASGSVGSGGDAETTSDVATEKNRRARKDKGIFSCYWMDHGERKEVPILLAQPQQSKPHSLQHLCRLAVAKQSYLWRNSEIAECLPLPHLLQTYIQKYPYPV